MRQGVNDLMKVCLGGVAVISRCLDNIMYNVGGYSIVFTVKYDSSSATFYSREMGSCSCLLVFIALHMKPKSCDTIVGSEFYLEN